MSIRRTWQKWSLKRDSLRLVTGLLILVLGGFTACSSWDQSDEQTQRTLTQEDAVNPEGRRSGSKTSSAVKTIAMTLDGNASKNRVETIRFNRDIRPILSENCYACHGPDQGTRKAGLRLDLEEGAFQERQDGPPAIVRGEPENSPLYQRISSSLKSERMPPPDSHKTLTDEQRRAIYRWIEQGAEWEGHWAFIQPVKPRVPSVSWGINEIDAFIYTAMIERGLTPNEEADRATLARRLSLDLTGLPPTPGLVESFVGDSSPNAYDRLVDRLLADPAYGEHQARYWLDAARYADTHGLHYDNYREIWPYRDWVVKSFNENKPFDEFAVEQIAGDLLPNATLEQKLATGFNRCNPTTNEGGVIEEEYRAIYATDRVEATSTVFMGLTMGCAGCHDHKFDPLSQKDFYQFSAFFNNLDGPILDGNAYDTPPIVVMPRAQHKQEWPRIRKEVESLEKALARVKETRSKEFRSWLASAHDVEFTRDSIDRELQAEIRFPAGDAEPQSSNDEPEHVHPVLHAKMGDRIDLTEAGLSFDPGQPFTLAVKLKLPREDEEKLPRISLLQQFDGDRGWRLSMANSDVAFPNRYQFTFELVHSLQKNEMISVTTREERINPREGSETTIYVIHDGSDSVAGLNIVVGSNRQRFDYDRVVDNLTGPASVDSPVQLGSDREGLIPPDEMGEASSSAYEEESEEESRAGVLKAVYFYKRPIYPFEVATLSGLDRLPEQLMVPGERRRPRYETQLENYYYLIHVPEYRKLKFEHAIREMEYHHIYDQATISLVMAEKESRPSAHVLARGQYDQPQEEVFADIPEVLGGLPESVPKNRLGLARWLVDPENPLTARVTVNRFWQSLFGKGLVETAEDFGTMGQNPSHPELLDWLAVTFQESDWDVKNLIRLMVTSATYRQDSRVDRAEYAIDSANRYLARGPRYRLDGEVLRDQALFVSGSLHEKLGGPPVKPYQPEGIWHAVAYSDSNTAYYRQDQGKDLYRRSLYNFWKRSAPPPNLVVFDAPSRETCTVRRERTNTPLQALTLMNDPQFVEAARKLAERVLNRVETENASERIRQMYTYAFGDLPPDDHLAVLSRSHQEFHSSFRKKPEEARKLIHVGDSAPSPGLDPVELASLTLVANQIMNLDSFINKY